MKRAVVVSTGCRTNQAEGCEIAKRLARAGFEVQEDGVADLYVINACTLTAKAERKARNLIYKAKKENPDAVVVLAGCLADRLQRFDDPHFFDGPRPDLLVPNSKKLRVAELIPAMDRSADVKGRFHPRYTTRRLLKVQDGCPRNCSYCIVPLVRGSRSVSVEPQEVVSMAKALEAEGALELVLTGIHIGLYGRDLRPRMELSDLIELLLKETEGIMIRLSSLEPEELKEGLIRLLGHPRIAAHLHLPLQSGSDRVLRDMHRPYTAHQYVELVRQVREVRRDIAIGMDVIVGYPTETPEDFEETLQVIREVKPAYMHVFRYSPRPGTPAWPLQDPVPYEEKHRRASILGQLSKDFRTQFARQFVGLVVRTVPVRRRGDLIEGLTENYMKVLYPGDMGRIVRIKVASFDGEFLLGEVEDEA